MSAELPGLVESFRRNGFCRLPGFLRREEMRELRRICDRVFEGWKRELGGEEALRRSTNMAYLTEPGYFREARDELVTLLRFVDDERIWTLLRSVAGTEPFFRNDQYFFEPPLESFDGLWHRDCQFEARSDEHERSRMERGAGVHFRVAFVPDPWLEYVPGSERRWDTPEELAVRKAPEEAVRSGSEMPGKVALPLESGDGLLFHGFGIHRGRYVAGRPRRTLDLIYEWGDALDFESPLRTCFGDESLLSELSPRARSLFSRLIPA